MSVTMDRIVVGVIVGGALLFLARRMVASIRAARAARAGCGTGCGCEGDRKAGGHPSR
ncbi:MAG: FeoB-associated Cys-rich membrane protein [Gemmatimonadota bacterium]|nr:FeoB-associated Cys-rich membrane protein [Gemmatimonadota bacterium]